MDSLKDDRKVHHMAGEPLAFQIQTEKEPLRQGIRANPEG
jgi:hypothetical protein